MRDRLNRFMSVRHGQDQYSMFLVAVYLVLYLITLLTDIKLFADLGTVFLLYSLFRVFSRNIPRRQAENAKFLKLTAPLVKRGNLLLNMYLDRDHRYFKCPSCGQHLRVPKGKGRVSITCRNCGISFEKKT